MKAAEAAVAGLKETEQLREELADARLSAEQSRSQMKTEAAVGQIARLEMLLKEAEEALVREKE